MKKPHKTKPQRPHHKRRDRHRDAAPAPHSTRRASPSTRADARAVRTHGVRSAGVYRRLPPLAIESKADRHAFRRLLLPFVVMALALAVVPSLHVFPTLKQLIAATPFSAAAPVVDVAAVSPRGAPTESLALSQPLAATLATATEMTLAPITGGYTDASPGPAPSAALTLAPDRALQPSQPPAAIALAAPPKHASPSALPPGSPVAAARPRITTATPQPPETAPAIVTPIPGFAEAAPRPAPLQPASTQVALLASPPAPTPLSPLPPRLYEPFCPVEYGSAAAAQLPDEPATGSQPFGARLAAAAAAQTANLVIYDDKYRQMARTGGDVPALYGVCTDVIVRAYRSVGIDLQTLVQASRIGSGDPNIDHRRTETLRRYFTRYGKSLPVTQHGENYEPGDIVTYWRPQNSGSRSHIAIVAATLGPSGRPMIIHNRGWGPQLEDGLFVDRITGHYRYDGTARPPLPPQLVTTPARPFVPASAATPATLRATGPAASTAAGL